MHERLAESDLAHSPPAMTQQTLFKKRTESREPRQIVIISIRGAKRLNLFRALSGICRHLQASVQANAANAADGGQRGPMQASLLAAGSAVTAREQNQAGA